jgi:uncharacterized protein (TIGR04255 family)
MSNSESMGKKLSKAPVYFVIAQVQFNQFSALDSYAPTVQDKFRKTGYPDTESVSLPVFDIVLGTPHGMTQQSKQTEIRQYSFFNFERTESFILSNDRLSFQTTHYDVFEEFSKKFLDGLKLVHEVMCLAYVVRTGLRYLDAVIPASDEKLSKYIDPHLLGLNEKSLGKLGHSFSEIAYINNEVTVTSRSMTMNGGLGVPPDLQMTSLNFLDRFKSVNSMHTVLDNDGSITERSQFDVELIGKQLNQIHDEIALAFKATVTSTALESWK